MIDASAAAISPELASVRGVLVSDYPPDSSLKEILARPLQRLKIRITSPIWPRWLPEVLDELEELTQLPQNWDSYGGQPVSSESLDRALFVLSVVMRADAEPPWIVPRPDGGVSFEWSSPGLEVEISVIGEDGSVEITDNGRDWEVSEDWSLLTSLRSRIPAANTA